MVTDDAEKMGRRTQELMDSYLDSKETFPEDIRATIESEYMRMWAEKLKWLEEHKEKERP